MRRPAGLAVLIIAGALAITGCGFDVQSPDLFLLTRTGQGPKLSLLVNDGGTIRCNGSKPKQITNMMLISARDLSDNLATDANKHLDLPPGPGTIFTFRIRLQQGTIVFSDRDTTHHKELAQAELFAVQAAQQVCGLSG